MPEIEPMVAQPTLSPTIAGRYRMAKNHSGNRGAMDRLSPLLDHLVDFAKATPRDDRQGVDLLLHGELAPILGFSAPENTNAADPKVSGDCMFAMVAGVGFEPTTFRL